MFLNEIKISNKVNNILIKNCGFTLLELLIVCAIISTLVAISIPKYQEYINKVKIKVAIVEIREIEKIIYDFLNDKKYLPNNLTEAGANWLDPWGVPYGYILIQGMPEKGKEKVQPRKDRSLHPINTDFDLFSNGPDRQSKLPLTAQVSQDDIIRAENGRFIGQAKDF